MWLCVMDLWSCLVVCELIKTAPPPRFLIESSPTCVFHYKMGKLFRESVPSGYITCLDSCDIYIGVCEIPSADRSRNLTELSKKKHINL